MGRLTGKVALITGAARGIGAAIAQAFVDEDAAHIAITDIRDPEGRALAATLGDKTAYETLDVRCEAVWEHVTETLLEQFGRLDIVVNNAGVTGFEAGQAPHNPEFADLEDWRAVHRVNLDGTFLGCKYAIRAMRQAGRGGSIVNIASRSGLVGIAGASAYASSKAAILTPMWEPMLTGLTGEALEQRLASFVADTPLHRFGRPEEVAAIAVMLASDEATYVTGAEFTIDGGLLAGSAASPERK